MTKKNKLAPAVFTATPLAEIEDDELLPPRRPNGQFEQGSTGNPSGRPVGSKNKFAEAFKDDIYTVWNEGGIAALRTVMRDEPAAFLRVMATLVPKELFLEARGAGLVIVKLSDEDMAL